MRHPAFAVLAPCLLVTIAWQSPPVAGAVPQLQPHSPRTQFGAALQVGVCDRASCGGRCLIIGDPAWTPAQSTERSIGAVYLHCRPSGAGEVITPSEPRIRMFGQAILALDGPEEGHSSNLFISAIELGREASSPPVGALFHYNAHAHSLTRLHEDIAVGSQFAASLSRMPDIDGDALDDVLVLDNSDPAAGVRTAHFISSANSRVIKSVSIPSTGEQALSASVAVARSTLRASLILAVGYPGSDAPGAKSSAVEFYELDSMEPLGRIGNTVAGRRFGLQLTVVSLAGRDRLMVSAPAASAKLRQGADGVLRPEIGGASYLVDVDTRETIATYESPLLAFPGLVSNSDNRSDMHGASYQIVPSDADNSGERVAIGDPFWPAGGAVHIYSMSGKYLRSLSGEFSVDNGLGSCLALVPSTENASWLLAISAVRPDNLGFGSVLLFEDSGAFQRITRP